ncbi:hypothetical protein PR048_024698 [Dryococelus australis]|uniref:Uncharacterized protein n=1 Tax=Dryococelus australis TaxID=614101 RepID=A0ABQ9GPC8_9NEOP|nr:hypothetical protein PR048_024698 [Dryococelus australis]
MTVATVGDMDLTDILNYELCAYPPALFESRTLLRKADKAQSAHAILRKCGYLSTADVPETQANVQYVLDGGSLLHRAPWKPGDTYHNIANSYVNFTFLNYGRAIVVFDDYDSAPFIKDITHRWRIPSNITKTVTFISGIKFVGQKENFLANGTNKQHNITFVSEAITKIGCTVQNSDGDADFDIVHSAVSCQIITTILVGEDTDLLILLLRHVKNNGLNCTSGVTLDEDYLPIPCTIFLAFKPCWTEADTLTLNLQCRRLCYYYMAILYKIGDSLQTLRHRMLMDVAAAKSFVAPACWPPKESAAKYHSFRMYYQSSVWISKETLLTPTEWGWFVTENSHYPTSDMPPAPEWLLKMIHCSCKTQCATMRCGCKQNGLPCSAS